MKLINKWKNEALEPQPDLMLENDRKEVMPQHRASSPSFADVARANPIDVRALLRSCRKGTSQAPFQLLISIYSSSESGKPKVLSSAYSLVIFAQF